MARLECKYFKTFEEASRYISELEPNSFVDLIAVGFIKEDNNYFGEFAVINRTETILEQLRSLDK